MALSLLCVCLGACAGACCRWGLNAALNPLFSALPLGTLAANWLGSLMMGVVLGMFSLYPAANPHWKLLLVTGFLGSFTTFSAFAGEMAALMASQRYILCAAGIFLHVAGCIALVFGGMGLVALIRKILVS